MFTGIIQATGRIKLLRTSGDRAELSVMVPWTDIEKGESIAVDGVCLTVKEFDKNKGIVNFDIGIETFSVTTLKYLKPASPVNLERAMKAEDRFGGHFVLGHVDGIGEIHRVIPHKDNREIWVKIPENLSPMIAEKGSIALNGVSLTVNKKKGDLFSVMIVPFTLNHTTLKYIKEGDKINIEVDVLARYIYSMLQNIIKSEKRGVDLEKLKSYGYY